jgi:hypothetical protein
MTVANTLAYYDTARFAFFTVNFFFITRTSLNYFSASTVDWRKGTAPIFCEESLFPGLDGGKQAIKLGRMKSRDPRLISSYRYVRLIKQDQRTIFGRKRSFPDWRSPEKNYILKFLFPIFFSSSDALFSTKDLKTAVTA